MSYHFYLHDVGWGKDGWASGWPLGPIVSPSGHSKPSTLGFASDFSHFLANEEDCSSLTQVPYNKKERWNFATKIRQICGLESGREERMLRSGSAPELHRKREGWDSRRHGGSHGHSYSIWCRLSGPRGWKIHWHGNTWGLVPAQAPLQNKSTEQFWRGLLEIVLQLDYLICNNRVLTNIFPVSAVNIEGIITELGVWVGGVKQEAVGAELLLRDVGHTLIVFVALLQVREETILLRTPEWRTSSVWNTEDEVGVVGWMEGRVGCCVSGQAQVGRVKCHGQKSGQVLLPPSNLRESQLSGQSWSQSLWQQIFELECSIMQFVF